MPLWLNIALLQGFWFLAVLGGPKEGAYPLVFLLSLLIVAGHFFTMSPKMPSINYLLFVIFSSFYGFLQDYALLKMDFAYFATSGYPLWLNSMYVVFICYYSRIFKKLPQQLWILSIFGAFGGLSSYFAGYKLGSLFIVEEKMFVYLAIITLSWAFYFPFSMWLYQKLENANLSLFKPQAS
tara:strand:- start:23947 stop:24489 length:543 start_codon:yes stop_codon:yes gene_type:complete